MNVTRGPAITFTVLGTAIADAAAEEANQLAPMSAVELAAARRESSGQRYRRGGQQPAEDP